MLLLKKRRTFYLLKILMRDLVIIKFKKNVDIEDAHLLGYNFVIIVF